MTPRQHAWLGDLPNPYGLLRKLVHRRLWQSATIHACRHSVSHPTGGKTCRDWLKQYALPSYCRLLSMPQHVIEQPLVSHVFSVEEGVGELEGHQEQGNRDNQ